MITRKELQQVIGIKNRLMLQKYFLFKMEIDVCIKKAKLIQGLT